jgi:hypothetical protein
MLFQPALAWLLLLLLILLLVMVLLLLRLLLWREWMLLGRWHCGGLVRAAGAPEEGTMLLLLLPLRLPFLLPPPPPLEGLEESRSWVKGRV